MNTQTIFSNIEEVKAHLHSTLFAHSATPISIENISIKENEMVLEVEVDGGSHRGKANVRISPYAPLLSTLLRDIRKRKLNGIL